MSRGPGSICESNNPSSSADKQGHRNYLDRQNLSQAYVSGMKEELGFRGNQLTVVNTIYSVGYLM